MNENALIQHTTFKNNPGGGIIFLYSIKKFFMEKKIRESESDNRKEQGFEQGQGQGSSESGFEGRQENQKNRGYEEDQPEQPVRSGKKTPADQQGENSSDKTYDDKTT